MDRETPFERLPPELGCAPAFSETQLAEVVSVKDPDDRNRVEIRLLTMDGVPGQDGPLWARVAVPVAGQNRGTFFIPSVGDEVLVQFINGDPRFPVVIGSMWNGENTAPETLGGSGRQVDRWTIVGKHGTRIAIVEERRGTASIELTTPGGVSATLTDQGPGSIAFEVGSTSVTFDPSGVEVSTSGKVKVTCSQAEVSASLVKVDAGMSKFSGIVKCDTLIANTVVSTTYTPGAGNVW